MNKKTRNILGITAGTAAAGAIILSSLVMNYGKPNFSQFELDEAQAKLKQIGNDYIHVRDRLIETTPGISDINYQIDSLYEVAFWSDAPVHDSLHQEIAVLEQKKDSLVSEQLNNDGELQYLGEKLANQGSRVLDLQADSTACAEIDQRTFKQQWQTIKQAREIRKQLNAQKQK